MKNIILSLMMAMTTACASNKTFTTEASWYGEKYRGLPMASGHKFNPDNDTIIASWDYPFGTRLRLTYNKRSVVGVVLDRGPARRLYKKGRKLDLSKALFKKLVGNTEQGIANIKVEVIKNEQR